VRYVRSLSRGACYKRKSNSSLDLYEAAWTGDTDGVRTCFQQGVFDKPNSQGWTALHLAAWNGHEDILHLLLSVTTVHITTEGPNGITPTQIAWWNGIALQGRDCALQDPHFTAFRDDNPDQLEKGVQPARITGGEY
jgi:hypothetical protein